MTVSASDDQKDKPSHTVVGQHLSDHFNAAKAIIAKAQPGLEVLDDVVTIFISPTETCRKTAVMPVLGANRAEMNQAISNFDGMGAQYYLIYEIPFLRELFRDAST
mmetsp:Transcript_1971/g.3076  ORF Transcript_1971/g.3076 Transcript_1971/m.3076 type:complete len:106 (+) Transcript_1971:381-698(+)